MKLSAFLEQLHQQINQHGDIDIFVLDFSKIGGPLREPLLVDSEIGYRELLPSGVTWKDLGLCEPSILIDYE